MSRSRNTAGAIAADKIVEDATEAALNGDQKMWSISGDLYFPCEETTSKLPPGQFIIQHSDSRGIYFVKKKVSLDDLIVLPDSRTENVLRSIEHFWTKEAEFRKHGFLWKRGVILHGPPGSGKTSCIQQLSAKIIDNGGMSVYCTQPSVDAEGLRVLRKIEPKRPIIVMIEDIDAMVEHFGETSLLAMLDGELQIDNVVFIATTNYPEDLDARFINRPSRFDEVIYIGMPKRKAREKYLTIKNPRLLEAPEELTNWVNLSRGFSIAQLKELIVSVECLDNTVESTVSRLRKMMESRPSSESAEDRKSFGFGNHGADDDGED